MEWLPRVIESIKKQTVQPSKIILVDNSSNDGSQDYASQHNCIVINYDKPEFNYSYALNIGIQETSENEVLILSAHCELVTPSSVVISGFSFALDNEDWDITAQSSSIILIKKNGYL